MKYLWFFFSSHFASSFTTPFVGMPPHYQRYRGRTAWQDDDRCRSVFLRVSAISTERSETSTANDIENNSGNDIELADLFGPLGASPRNLLRFDTAPSSPGNEGIRGVYPNRDIEEGEVVLSIPLSSCLRDDSPPRWFESAMEEIDSPARYTPGGWATRLAASLMDLQQQRQSGSLENEGYLKWLSLLPDAEFLRASLPVHWSEETVESARSTALELTVDAAYFARAEAVEDLVEAVRSQSELQTIPPEWTRDEDLRRICNNALDLIQTRSCRVVPSTSEGEDAKPLRILAPIFDFLNHGKGSKANCGFELESSDDDNDEPNLVLRALRDIRENEEVLIHYGGSTQPAWRCLLSYGFIPRNEGKADTEDEIFESSDVAEVYMGGVRYEVGPSHVPVDLVAAGSSVEDRIRDLEFDEDEDEDEEGGDEQEIVLTPQIAERLANRISEVAYYLLLEPERGEFYDDDEIGAERLTPSHVISSQQAASLRWSQHRVLLACAKGLREFAEEQQT